MAQGTRRPMMAANWKMNKTAPEAEAYTAALLPRVADAGGVDVVVCGPFTCLSQVARMTAGSGIVAGAQNFYYEDSGAFTGEVSVPMLLDLGVGAVIVGHSERRELFGETDLLVARKTAKAIDSNLLPIVCVGETKEERDASPEGMWEKVSGQVNAVLEALDDGVDGGSVVFAYEPIWAIGTGETATPEDAQDAIGRIRTLLRETRGDGFADGARILYGGSVKPSNAPEIMAQPDVDGALVGGASLDAETFSELVAAANAADGGANGDSDGEAAAT